MKDFLLNLISTLEIYVFSQYLYNTHEKIKITALKFSFGCVDRSETLLSDKTFALAVSS